MLTLFLPLFLCCYKKQNRKKKKKAKENIHHMTGLKIKYPNVLWNTYLSSVDYCKTILIFVARCYPEILPVFFTRILKTPTTLGSVLQKREWRVLRLLPTFVQFRLRTLFLALMSMHKNAASSPAQSPNCFADLYIYVVRASALCQRTAVEIIFLNSAMWHTVLV